MITPLLYKERRNYEEEKVHAVRSTIGWKCLIHGWCYWILLTICFSSEVFGAGHALRSKTASQCYLLEDPVGIL